MRPTDRIIASHRKRKSGSSDANLGRGGRYVGVRDVLHAWLTRFVGPNHATELADACVWVIRLGADPCALLGALEALLKPTSSACQAAPDEGDRDTVRPQ